MVVAGRFLRGVVPVTAKLSRRFYETFGDEIANELVEWFNAVDATYRADLRELNELNFARFDAKVEQRFAAFELKIEQRFAAFELNVEQRLERFEQRLERFEQRLGQVEQRLGGIKAELIGWMFGFWIGTVALFFLARLL